MNLKKIRFYLIFIILFFQYFISTVFSNQPFSINSGSLKIIPYKHFEYLEGFNESVSFSTLENQKWSNVINQYSNLLMISYYHSSRKRPNNYVNYLC